MWQLIPSTWRRYGFALAAVLLAWLLKSLLLTVFDQSSDLPFAIAIVAATGYGGISAGLLSTTLAAATLFLTPQFSPASTIWLLCGGGLLTWLTQWCPSSSSLGWNEAAWRKAELKLQRAKDELEVQVSQRTQALEGANQSLEQRVAERTAELQKSEDLFRTSIENMLDCFGIYRAIRDEAGQIVDFQVEYVNTAACVGNVLSREEQIGKRLCELLPSHRESGLFDEYCQVVETQQPLVKEAVVYRDFYGQQYLNRVFDIRIAPFGDSFVATWRDVTEMRQAEALLRASEAKFRRLTDCNVIGVMFWQADGTVLDANEAFLTTIGYTREDLQAGRINWRTMTPPDQISWSDRAVAQMQQVGFADTLEKEYIRKDGKRVSVLLGGVMFEGETDRGVSFVLDLTERKQAELERAELLLREQEARKRAEAASRTKDEFLAIVSHELRSPLNAILGWSRLLRTRKLNEETALRALEVIERNAQAQTQLIEDLLDISRIIRGQIRLYSRSLNLISVIEAALDTVRPAADAKQIQLIANLDPHTGVVSGDVDRLQQVVWNLLSNAVKFTPEAGRVEIHLARHDRSAQITVADTGIGISSEFLPYVFERFRQAESGTTRTQGGLGLGLAIVRNLVELHGGTIQVHSAGEGQGSTFTIGLPLLKEDSSAQRASPSLPAAPVAALTLSGLNVLLVEDEDDTREFLIAALEQYGAIVQAAPSASEALRCLETCQPDVLISDIGMPLEDGYSLIRKVRSLTPELGGQIPAAALTAYAREEDRVKALAAGFQLHVPKPIDPIHLAQVVVRLAGRREP